MRLPAKSVARFRCVSKLCDSTLIKPDFIESFNAISSSRPKILLTCLKDGETFFFSSPKPQDSSPLAASFHMSFPINRSFEICRPVLGLVCGLNQQTLKGRIVTIPWICNPITGESLTLPKLKTRWRDVRSYQGYDPIDKQFKLLCTWSYFTHVGEGSFGQTKYDGICINGALYYLTYVSSGDGHSNIVCFEFRYETFKCIKNAQGMRIASQLTTLVNYKGKLAILQPYNNVNGRCTGYQLWVLEDAENQQWLNYIYVCPPQTKLVEEALCFVGTSDTGEIVLLPKIISDSFYLIYYNPERSTFTRVGIQGMEAFKDHIAYAFLDHVEDLRQVSTIIGSEKLI